MIEKLTVASPTSLERTFGFDGKFVVKAGFKFTFAQGEIIYEQRSGFKVQDGDRKGDDIMTLFVAREVGADKKIEALTLNALARTSLPAGATIMPGGEVIDLYDVNKDIALTNGSMTARALIDSLAGKTLVLAKITPYQAINTRNRQLYTGKCYHWQLA